MKILLSLFFVLNLFYCSAQKKQDINKNHNLSFSELAQTWDEAIPLGNGMLGNLVWQKNGKLRFSLDRADLWDLRPMENIDFDKWKFKDVYRYWANNKYKKVQKVFDVPYGKLPAPSKIPAGAIEFDIKPLGKVKSVELDVETASCRINWENGTVLTTFIHAEKPIGWYRFENLNEEIEVALIPPDYNKKGNRQSVNQSYGDLDQLGYEQGLISIEQNTIKYKQKAWGGLSYQVSTKWLNSQNKLEGCWSIATANKNWGKTPSTKDVIKKEFGAGFDLSFNKHKVWWQNYWKRSVVEIPDMLLEKQYYLEMYKFGSAARNNTPPISLQAVWTADNGKLPPWKGDFHHDLNTQLSYWPSYTGNYLDLEEGFLNWLWKYRPEFKEYTKAYFGTDGMNVPGVTTLEGKPMGGWIQYSMGQTVGAWLAHHFYLHWRYSMDRDFLKERAYPWIKDVAVYLDEISVKNKAGKRKLLISSSPETNDNSRDAWFAETTNFDLALIRWTYEKAAELALELNLQDDAKKWEQILSEWPELAVDSKTGLMLAPGFPYHESHRHFSHLLAFHPLGIIDFSNGQADKEIISNTLKNLEEKGSDYWVGYSFSWAANLYARAFEGDKAAEKLRVFAKCFCLKNSFHVNGDQCKAGHSKFTYRPFTLEGNFAFAAAIQEMLLQSHTGVVRIFPAIPKNWKNARFKDLRVQGAFLISATMQNGQVTTVKIVSEKGGKLILSNPFGDNEIESAKDFDMENGQIVIHFKEGETAVLKAKI